MRKDFKINERVIYRTGVRQINIGKNLKISYLKHFNETKLHIAIFLQAV